MLRPGKLPGALWKAEQVRRELSVMLRGAQAVLEKVLLLVQDRWPGTRLCREEYTGIAHLRLLDRPRQETLELGRHHLRKVRLLDRAKRFGERTRILGAEDKVELVEILEDMEAEEEEEGVVVVMEEASISEIGFKERSGWKNVVHLASVGHEIGVWCTAVDDTTNLYI